MKERCEVRRYNNTMMCGLCGLQWDFNDEDRPECSPAPPPTMERQPNPSKSKPITDEQWKQLRESLK
jgi:hypothetical protein